MARKRRLLAVAVTLGLGVLGWAWFSGQRTEEATNSREAVDATGLDPAARLATSRRAAVDKPNFRLVRGAPIEPGETTPDWASLSATERRERLEREFETAMYIPPEKTSKKFMIAHEIGHWLQANWTDTVVASGYYEHAQQDKACVFRALDSNSIHGLRSSERGPAAIAEGWGQFIASWTFDDPTTFDAQFKYYKMMDEEAEIQYQDLLDDNFQVSLVRGSCNDEYPEYSDSCPANEHIVGGENAWVEYMCPNDWDYDDPDFGMFEISSELDWMRFFWQLTSNDVDSRLSSPASGDPADLWELLELWRLGAGNTSVWWTDLDTAVSDPNNTDIYHLSERFDQLTITNGVNNGHGKY